MPNWAGVRGEGSAGSGLFGAAHLFLVRPQKVGIVFMRAALMGEGRGC